jgi:hypothetical protein
MLDFLLVLGQIPGTNFQVSFWGLVIGIIGTWLTIRVYRRPALRRKYVYRFRLAAFYVLHFRALRRLQN